MDSWLKRAPYEITLPDGTKESIPKGVYPVYNGRWCQMDTDAAVETTAQALEKAEREYDAALARRDFLRGLMGRVIDAAERVRKGPPSIDPADLLGLPVRAAEG